MLCVGVDIVEVRRIDRHVRRFGHSFLRHVYCPSEVSRYETDSNCLASAFAAKEAVVKALGVGFAYLATFGVLPVEIEVVLSEPPAMNTCQVTLHGAALQRAVNLQLVHWALAVFRLDDYVIALVMAASADVSLQLTQAATIAAGRGITTYHLSRKSCARSRYS